MTITYYRRQQVVGTPHEVWEATFMLNHMGNDDMYEARCPNFDVMQALSDAIETEMAERISRLRDVLWAFWETRYD